MADLSQYNFTGRLGSDAVVKTTPNGKPYMEMSCAVTTGYGDYKKTLWVKVKQWGERVNNIVNIFTKGSLIAASGEISLNTWTGKDGEKRTDIEVTCMNINLLKSKQAEQKQDPVLEPEEEAVF